jgi:diaminopimelate epimerase
MKIAKAHGLGNDFLIVAESDAPADPATWARRLCDRHVGAGADGVLLYAPDERGVRMRLLNADGGEAEISANGLRCLAAYVSSRHGVPPHHEVVTGAGPREVFVESLGGCRFRVATDLGVPVLNSAEIPMTLPKPRSPVVDHRLVAAGRPVRVTVTSLGNPHCAVFCERAPEDDLLATLGPALERHAVFPRRTNVEFVTVVSRTTLRVRFWERGVGYTRASGTGAASAAVAAILRDVTDRQVTVACDGGSLHVEWPEGGSVRQVGEVELLYEGEWLAAFHRR